MFVGSTNIKIKIISRFGEIELSKSSKIDFDDIITLHANIYESSDQSFIGTDMVLTGIQDSDIYKAKKLFLRF